MVMMMKRANFLYITVSGLLFLNFILLFFILDTQKAAKPDESLFSVSDKREPVEDDKSSKQKRDEKSEVTKEEKLTEEKPSAVRTEEKKLSEGGGLADEKKVEITQTPVPTEEEKKVNDRVWKSKERNSPDNQQANFFEKLHQELVDQLVSVEFYTKNLEKEIQKRKESSPQGSVAANALISSLDNLILRVRKAEEEHNLLSQKISLLRRMLIDFSSTNQTQKTSPPTQQRTTSRPRLPPTPPHTPPPPSPSPTPPATQQEVQSPPLANQPQEHFETLESIAQYIQEVVYRRQSITTEQCKTEKLLLCSLVNSCGFACAIHQLSLCLVMAYANNRTLALQHEELWRYAHGCHPDTEGESFECFFEKLSNCPRRYEEEDRIEDWTFEREPTNRILRMPFYSRAIMLRDDYHYRTYGWANTDGNNIGIPMYLPSEVKSDLKRLVQEPRSWFVGQLEAFLMRPNPRMKKLLSDLKAQMQLPESYFAIHVRRTDKLIREAKFHHLDEYMGQIEDYIASRGSNSSTYSSSKKEKKRMVVFVATDDPRLDSETDKWTDKYEFKRVEFNHHKGSEMSSPKERWNRNGAEAVIADIHFLSQAEYLVGTLSSQVTRLAYELQQTHVLNRDCTKNCTKSLDHPWYFP